MLPGRVTYGGQLFPGGLDALLLNSCAAGQPDGEVFRESCAGQGTDMSEERYSAPVGLEEEVVPRFGAFRRRRCFSAHRSVNAHRRSSMASATSRTAKLDLIRKWLATSPGKSRKGRERWQMVTGLRSV